MARSETDLLPRWDFEVECGRCAAANLDSEAGLTQLQVPSRSGKMRSCPAVWAQVAKPAKSKLVWVVRGLADCFHRRRARNRARARRYRSLLLLAMEKKEFLVPFLGSLGPRELQKIASVDRKY